MRNWPVDCRLAGCSLRCKQVGSNTDSSAARNAAGGAPIVADARIGTPNPPRTAEGEWTMPARDYASSRYSTLAQITSANAKSLKAAWTFSTGVLRGHEGQPLVVNKTMYLVTPYPNVAYAIDLTQPGFPLKWKYRPDNAQAAVGTACCDVVNRGAAYAEGKLVYNLLDGHTVAVDAESGKQLWRVQMADLNRGETITMAPIIVKNRVIVGSSGGEMGVRGWIAALDLATGRELWRAYNTGSDADVKIGAAVQALLRHRARQRPRPNELARRRVEDRRRRGVGLAVVRSRAQSRVSRDVESRAVESGRAARRQ